MEYFATYLNRNRKSATLHFALGAPPQ